MPGSAKCQPECTCWKHNKPRMSMEEARARQRETSRTYYEAHREEILEKQRQDPERRRQAQARWAALPEEKRERQREMTRDWYRRNPRSPEKNAEMHYRARYGMSLEQRAQMFTDQQGLCYLCAEPLPGDKRKIHTDHDRSCCRGSKSCGTCVRGLACEGCNTAIGSLGESPERMRRVADNLEMANRRLRSPVPAMRGSDTAGRPGE